jgi:hypothetical protein
VQSLEGNWREEPLFVLKQSLEMYDLYLEKIASGDQRIEAHLKTMTAKVDVQAQPMPKARRAKYPRRHQPRFDLRGQLYRVTGVDLTQIDGIDVQTAQTLISEVGVEMNAWKTEHHFSSWLGLCPDNRVSGGKVLKRRTRRVISRASTALRLAAWNLLRKPERSGSQLPPPAGAAGRPQSDHRPGSQTGPTRLSPAQIREPIRRQRCGLLRNEIPPTPDQMDNETNRRAKSPTHSIKGGCWMSFWRAQRRIYVVDFNAERDASRSLRLSAAKGSAQQCGHFFISLPDLSYFNGNSRP